MIHLDSKKQICEHSGGTLERITEVAAFIKCLKDEFVDKGGSEDNFCTVLVDALNVALNLEKDEEDDDIYLDDIEPDYTEPCNKEDLEDIVEMLFAERHHGRN